MPAAATSLKEISKSLWSFFAQEPPELQLPDQLLEQLHAYLEKPSSSQKLHDELLHLYQTRLKSALATPYLAPFLEVLRILRPAITDFDCLSVWCDLLEEPMVKSVGKTQRVMRGLHAVVLDVLESAADAEDAGSSTAAKLRRKVLGRLIELYLTFNRFENDNRITVARGAETVLTTGFGKHHPKMFLSMVNEYVKNPASRLQTLSLLCSFVSLQGPHLHQVLETPLFGSLLSCMESDTSTSVISLALTVFVMFLPHICSRMAPHLSRIFTIYVRIICWDQQGAIHRGGTGTASKGWEKLDSSFDTAPSPPPDVLEFFTFLYGLYPINFLAYIRDPYALYNASQFSPPFEIDEEVIRDRSLPFIRRHAVHPNFLSMDAETELSDKSRWLKFEPGDIVAMCTALDTITMSQHQPDPPQLPHLLPTEEIPYESLLGGMENNTTGAQLLSGSGVVSATGSPRISDGGMHSQLASPAFPHADLSTKSPRTVSSFDQTKSPKDMLMLHKALISSVHESQPAVSAEKAGKDADVKMLSFLQREVLLLRNELNFEKYLKKQHLERIGKLQREHILDSNVEAERQNLYNTTRAFKHQIEGLQQKLAQAASLAATAKNRRLKWESDLEGKIKVLQEDRLRWEEEQRLLQGELSATRLEADGMKSILDEAKRIQHEVQCNMTMAVSEREEYNSARAQVEALTTKLAKMEQTTYTEDDLHVFKEQVSTERKRSEETVAALRHEYGHSEYEYTKRISELHDKLEQVSAGSCAQTSVDSLVQSIQSSKAQEVKGLREERERLTTRCLQLEEQWLDLKAQLEVVHKSQDRPARIRRHASEPLLADESGSPVTMKASPAPSRNSEEREKKRRKDKSRVESEFRLRGRGGVQNIGGIRGFL